MQVGRSCLGVRVDGKRRCARCQCRTSAVVSRSPSFLPLLPGQYVAPLQLLLQLLLAWQNQPIFGGKELLVFLQHRIAHQGFVFVGTQNNAQRGVVVGVAL